MDTFCLINQSVKGTKRKYFSKKCLVLKLWLENSSHQRLKVSFTGASRYCELYASYLELLKSLCYRIVVILLFGLVKTCV